MTVYFSDDSVTLYHGDCLAVLCEMPDGTVDSVVTDPPYGLAAMTTAAVADTVRRWATGERDYVPVGAGFMGKSWDAFVPPPAVWDECARVLKPGGHLLAFAGSRTHDLMTLSIRLAGFEIRDSIATLYGSGFPKSLDVSKAIDKAAGAEREVVGSKLGLSGYGVRNGIGACLQMTDDNWQGVGVEHGGLAITAPATDAAKQWQGFGTALKPSYEPVVVARKPLVGTVAQNVTRYGTGALNIDGCRIETTEDLGRKQTPNMGGAFRFGGLSTRAELEAAAADGRKCPSGEDAALILARTDKQYTPEPPSGRWPPNVVLYEHAAAELDRQTAGTRAAKPARSGSAGGPGAVYNQPRGSDPVDYGDEGGASRFFPVFKYTAKAPTDERPEADGVRHPTVKSVELMRWLIRLVAPPHGLVLDPFAGSGTTGEAAVHEHMRAILIEREPDYLPLIASRLSKPMEIGFDFDGVADAI